MKKIMVLIYIIGLCCFVLSTVKTKDTLGNITRDFDSSIYIALGHKEYNKDVVVSYYKQVLRYLLYFVYFIDFENLMVVNNA